MTTKWQVISFFLKIVCDTFTRAIKKTTQK